MKLCLNEVNLKLYR
ncbi:hypothetical protein F383_17149 [Gossypium arboreum]|nr:hypothetical protein F383_17149 [Gossypium arboreum]